MSEEYGLKRLAGHVYDRINKRWVKEPLQNVSQVSISGVTPTAAGRLPVDTELTLQGDVIVENVRVSSAPLTEVYPSGIYAQLIQSDDLVTIVQYNEPSARTTISGVTYSSSALGTAVIETYVSGTNYTTISRSYA